MILEIIEEVHCAGVNIHLKVKKIILKRTSGGTHFFIRDNGYGGRFSVHRRPETLGLP